MCGEYGMKRAVYNMKEKHAKGGDRKIKKKHKEHSKEKKSLETKERYFFQSKNKLLYRF